MDLTYRHFSCKSIFNFVSQPFFSLGFTAKNKIKRPKFLFLFPDGISFVGGCVDLVPVTASCVATFEGKAPTFRTTLLATILKAFLSLCLSSRSWKTEWLPWHSTEHQKRELVIAGQPPFLWAQNKDENVIRSFFFLKSSSSFEVDLLAADGLHCCKHRYLL